MTLIRGSSLSLLVASFEFLQDDPGEKPNLSFTKRNTACYMHKNSSQTSSLNCQNKGKAARGNSLLTLRPKTLLQILPVMMQAYQIQ